MGMFLISLVAFLLLPALLIYSLIKPAKFNIRTKKNPNGKWSRGKFSAAILAVWVVSIGIGIAITPDQNTAIDVDEVVAEVGIEPDDYEVKDNGAIEVKSQADDTLEAKEIEPFEPVYVEKSTDKTFGITPLEFSRQFSAEAKEVGFGEVPYGDFETIKGAVNDTFSTMLSEAIAMNGTVDKNGELKGITFIMGKTQNGDREGLNMAMMAGLSARAISPDVPKEESAGTVMKVLAEALNGYEENGEGEASKVVDDVKYTALASKTIGIWITIEPA
ncbi:hypothetical protein [Psychrobacter sp. UBA2514]|jgi:hypothetical protein|uniref:hypothetical protein n=1 Tax=Psychrobacter sp. UBA2514 TaxID=1947346 RepID=UPI002580B162|nr:hypothetical protein [Psychrobacter sp. UBA2514]|tara:strand:- start:23156 stop:23980 length:825 start_codon:yes stop_codon:yes gene_type:complete